MRERSASSKVGAATQEDLEALDFFAAFVALEFASEGAGTSGASSSLSSCGPYLMKISVGKRVYA